MGRELPETDEQLYQLVDTVEPTKEALNARGAGYGRHFVRVTMEHIEALLLGRALGFGDGEYDYILFLDGDFAQVEPAHCGDGVGLGSI